MDNDSGPHDAERGTVFRYKAFLTQDLECEYFKNRMQRLELAFPLSGSSADLYNALSRGGFRRQGDVIYCTRCHDCKRCIASRVPADLFRRDRTMQKIWNRNEDLSQKLIIQPKATREQFDLYNAYVEKRHPGSSMIGYTFEQFSRTLFNSCTETAVIEYRLEGKLVLVSIVDLFTHGMSAVYTFYDPELPRRSLGTYSILNQLELTKNLGPDKHLYLGFWLCYYPNMDYKRRFQPFEVYWDKRWQPLSECEEAISQASQESD